MTAAIPVQIVGPDGTTATVVGGGLTTTAGGGGTAAVNLTQVSGAVISLGQTLNASSLPVALASDSSLAISGSVTASGSVQSIAGTTGGMSVASAIVPNNVTAVVVKGSAGQVYAIECFNSSTTIAYLKIYDATSATAGAGTPTRRYLIPGPTAGGGGFTVTYPTGDLYATGITYVVTTAIADNDTTAPAASTYIVQVHFK